MHDFWRVCRGGGRALLLAVAFGWAAAPAAADIKKVPKGCFKSVGGKIICPGKKKPSVGIGTGKTRGVTFGSGTGKKTTSVRPSKPRPKPAPVSKRPSGGAIVGGGAAAGWASAGGATAGAGGANTGGDIRASRTFIEPHRLPPRAFAAYGIVAFSTQVTSWTRDRHKMICEAYIASLPESGELAVAEAKQMVTVWPVTSRTLAEDLESKSPAVACQKAIDGYHLPTSLGAIRDAQAAGYMLDGEGPFLIAWAPASKKGQPDVPVLSADLSDAKTPTQVMEIMRKWRDDIEANPDLWGNGDGWSLEAMRLKVRDWADHFGRVVLKFTE